MFTLPLRTQLGGVSSWNWEVSEWSQSLSLPRLYWTVLTSSRGRSAPPASPRGWAPHRQHHRQAELRTASITDRLSSDRQHHRQAELRPPASPTGWAPTASITDRLSSDRQHHRQAELRPPASPTGWAPTASITERLSAARSVQVVRNWLTFEQGSSDPPHRHVAI